MAFATPAGGKFEAPLGTPARPAALQSISTKRLLVLHSLNDYGAQTMGRVELSSVSHAAKRNTIISRQQCELTRRDGGLTPHGQSGPGARSCRVGCCGADWQS